MIVKEGDEWILKSSDGSKVLGRHKTREEAEAQERAVQSSKHDSARVCRYDRAPIASSKRTQEGFLRIDGSRIARTGVQEYRRADGSVIRELREPSVVFDSSSMRSLALLPLTNTHPPKMLDPSDAKAYAVGAVGEAIKLDDKWLTAPISVWDKAAIQAIEDGRVQLSAGYSCEIVHEPGEWNGQKYDCKQKGVTFNHLSLVDVARAGPEARLRLDAGDAELVDDVVPCREVAALDRGHVDSNQETMKMPHVLKIDGFSFEVNDPNAQNVVDKALAAAKNDGDTRVAAEKLRTDAEAQARADVLKQLDEVKGKYDALTEKLKADAEKMMKCDECGGKGECKACEGKGEYPAKMMDSVEFVAGKIERMAEKRAAQKAVLYTTARQHLGQNEKLDGKSDLEIMTAVVKKYQPKANLDGQSAEYIKARFDGCLDAAPKPVDVAVMNATQVKTTQANADAQPATDPDTARQRMLARYMTANGKAR